MYWFGLIFINFLINFVIGLPLISIIVNNFLSQKSSEVIAEKPWLTIRKSPQKFVVPIVHTQVEDLSEKVVSPKPKVGFLENVVDSSWKFINLYNPMVTDYGTCTAMWVGTIAIGGCFYLYRQNSNLSKKIDTLDQDAFNGVKSFAEDVGSEIRALKANEAMASAQINTLKRQVFFTDSKVQVLQTQAKTGAIQINTLEEKADLGLYEIKNLEGGMSSKALISDVENLKKTMSSNAYSEQVLVAIKQRFLRKTEPLTQDEFDNFCQAFTAGASAAAAAGLLG